VLRFKHLLWSISQGFLKDYERPDIAVPTSSDPNKHVNTQSDREFDDTDREKERANLGKARKNSDFECNSCHFTPIQMLGLRSFAAGTRSARWAEVTMRGFLN
jgi:hypothetical protein